MRTRLAAAALSLLTCGTPPSAVVSSLSTAQTRQWCRERSARYEASYPEAQRRQLACNVRGLVLPGLLAFERGQALSPTELVRACEAELATCSGVPSGCDQALADPTCDATVADVEACFDAQLVALDSLLKGPRCDLLALDGGAGLVLPACPRLDTRCPGKGLLTP